jgi:hypothetical protein
VAELLAGGGEPGAVLDTDRPLRDLPSAEERAPEILAAHLARRLPCVYPAVFIPVPYGGTAFFERLRRQRRLLEALPFACYGDPYLTFLPRHYDPVDYYTALTGLMAAVTDPRLWLRRLGAENLR